MKHIYKFLIPALLVVFASCEPSHLEDNLPSAGVCFVNSGVQKATIFDTQKSVEFPVYAYCGSFYDANPEVEVTVDESSITRYNEKNRTSYKVLPSDCYTLDRTKAQMENKKASFNVTFDVQKVVALSQTADYSDISQYVIPLTLRSLTAGVSDPVSEEVGSEFIMPVLSEVTYSVLSCNSYHSEHPAELIHDGDITTYWENASANNHTGSVALPYEIVMELPMPCMISGFELYRYPQIKKTQKETVSIELSEDNFNWIKVVDAQYGTDSSNNTAGPISHSFAPVSAKYVRYTVTDASRRSTTGVKLAAVAEFNIIVE